MTFANSLIQKMAADDPAYRTVYLYGPSAVTAALATAAESEIRRAHPNARIIRTTGSAFCLKVRSLCAQGSLSQMLCAHTGDLLIVEGIGEIAGNATVEEELYRILDWYLEQGKPFLVTGDASVACIRDLAPRIRAQLSGGICIAVE